MGAADVSKSANASAVADIPDEIESAASIFNYNNIKGFD